MRIGNASKETDVNKGLRRALALALATGLAASIVGAAGCSPSKPAGGGQGSAAVTGSTPTTSSSGPATDGPVTRHEQTDPDIYYQGTWVQQPKPWHSAGSYAFTNTSGGKATIKFNGTGITYVTNKDNIYGIAKVTLDGGTPVNVDLYSATRNVSQQPVWSSSTLDKGDHTLVIEWTGTKNDSSHGTYIGLDAVDVVGELVPAH